METVGHAVSVYGKTNIMALGLTPRLLTLAFVTVIFYLILSGLLSTFVAIPITVILTLLIHFHRFDQLPSERLHKFSPLFDLTDVESDKEDRRRRIILHRGGCADAPENTLEAIREVY